MLTIVVGPNGSGKSLWCLHQIVFFLRRDPLKRKIVTSVAVDPAKLNDYCQRHYGEEAPDVTTRLILINKDQQRTFWRYRSQEYDGEYGIQLSPRGPFGDGSWQCHDGGIIYILDEAQTTFGAREWTKTGPEFCSYQSQHRHFSDDVIAVTPATALLDKQFRVLAGECVVLSNLYKLKVGIVKAPRQIRYQVYQNAPPAPAETPLSSGTLHIDGKGLAGCYDTAAGLGHIGGGQADKGQESKGLPFWTLFVGLFVALVVSYFVLTQFLHWGAGKAMTKTRIATPPPAAPAPPPGPMPGFGIATGPLPPPPPSTNDLYCKAIFFDRAVLSDGRTLRKPAWKPLTDDSILFGNVVLSIR